jgi:hypothetical protein
MSGAVVPTSNSTDKALTTLFETLDVELLTLIAVCAGLVDSSGGALVCENSDMAT